MNSSTDLLKMVKNQEEKNQAKAVQKRTHTDHTTTLKLQNITFAQDKEKQNTLLKGEKENTSAAE